MIIKKLLSLSSDINSTKAGRDNLFVHKSRATMFSYILALEINHSVGREVVSIEKLLTDCVIHDLDKSVTGSTPYFVRSNNTIKEALSQISLQGIGKFITDLGYNNESGIGFDILRSWLHSNKDTLEGYIISMGDIFSGLHILWEEVTVRNNLFMAKDIYRIQEDIGELGYKIESLPEECVSVITSVLKSLNSIAEEIAIKDIY